MLTFPVTLYSGTAATRTATASASVAGSTSTPNFGTLALGTAQGTSLVVVIVYAWNFGTATSALSTLTIDGSAATIHENAVGLFVASSASIVGIASRASSNTSGGISATFTTNMDNSHIAVYRLNNLTSATPSDHQKATTTNGTTLSLNLNVPSSGIVLAGSGTVFGTATLIAITGVTQDAQGEFLTHGDQYVANSNQSSPANAALTISSLWGTANTGALAAVSWS